MDVQERVNMYSIWRRIGILSMGLIFSMGSHGSEEYRYPDVKQVVFAGQFKRVTIDVHRNSDVVVESVTNKDILSFQQTGDVLSIKTTNNQNSVKSSQIVNGGITNIAIGENASSVVSIGGVEASTIHNSQSLAEVSVIVPKDTSIRLQGGIANAQIGDTFGKLVLDMRGRGKIEAGSVSDVSANLAGAASIHIERITGDLLVDIAGSGRLAVDSGEIRLLNVATTGVGNVNVNAVVDKASIHVTGAGTVKVKQVKTKPEVSIVGAGSVDVGSY